MDAAPPQRSACSPNQSVSTSSLNVVWISPARALPIAFAIPSVLSQAFPVKSWCTATIDGVPKFSRYVSRTLEPGPFGATMIMSISFGASIHFQWIAAACENDNAFPLERFGPISAL